MTDVKHCSICNCAKPLTDFYQWPNKKIKVSAYCKPCTKQRVKEREKAKPDQYKAMHKAHREKNKEKLATYFAEYRADPERREKAMERSRQWRQDNRERHDDNHRRSKYGLAPGEYARMLVAQDGKCAICGVTEAGGKGTFHVDHCHRSKAVRGLLCHHCNLMLGHARDNVEVMESAIRYLTQ